MKEINFKDIPFYSMLIAVILTTSFIMFYGIQTIIYDQKDVNRDGKVNSQDYVIIKNYIMERNECK